MNFHFNPLTISELPQLADWLNRPHLQQWWRSGEIFVEFSLFKDLSLTEIRIDPRPDNLRVLHCYKKVGFRRIGEIANPDSPAVIMILTRQAFSDNHLQ